MRCFFWIFGRGCEFRVGRCRERAKERAMGYSAAATAPAIAALIALTHDTPSPSAFVQVNGYKPSDDAMRVYLR